MSMKKIKAKYLPHILCPDCGESIIPCVYNEDEKAKGIDGFMRCFRCKTQYKLPTIEIEKLGGAWREV